MKIQLHWKIFIGLCLGFCLGLLSRLLGFESFVQNSISVIGEIFLRCLRMIIIPLITVSIVSSVASISSGECFGRLSIKTFVYYVSTSLFAIVTGLILVNIIMPGKGAQLGLQAVPNEVPAQVEKLGELLLNIIPINPFAALAKGDIVPIIFFSLLFGFFITKAPDPAKTYLRTFFDAAFNVMMLLTHFIIQFTPLGVFALLADITARSGFEVFIPLGRYMLTVALGLSLHACITLPVLLFLLGRAKPIKHFRAVSGALMTAFSTASSSATLPLTLESVRENDGVSDNVSGFVLPLGATINMDGTALYECVAAIFIAQAYGIDLTFFQQFLVVLTALLASIGAAGIPMAGLVMIAVILRAVGLPLEGMGLILAVDRILDMMRTSVNTWSDTCGAVIIARTEGETTLKV